MYCNLYKRDKSNRLYFPKRRRWGYYSTKKLFRFSIFFFLLHSKFLLQSKFNHFYSMSEVEYRCFIGGLSWATKDDDLRDAFEKFGRLSEAKVVTDRFSGRSRGFGFVTFNDKKAMEEAIDAMNGIDLDGRPITVDKAQPQGGGRDRDGGDRGYGRDRDRGYGGGGGGGGDCFKCGKPGHFARECPSGDGGRGGDRYGGGGGGGGSRYGPDRNGDRYSGGGRSRDGGSHGGSGSDRYNRDRSGPYERSSGGGGYRS